MNFYDYDPDNTTPQEHLAREAWWNFSLLAEAEEEYGYDENTPWFVWRDRSSIWLPDGSSRWVDVPEPYIAQLRFDNRDAKCGTNYYKLPASQRYTLRLQRWQEAQRRLDAEVAAWFKAPLLVDADTEPF